MSKLITIIRKNKDFFMKIFELFIFKIFDYFSFMTFLKIIVICISLFIFIGPTFKNKSLFFKKLSFLSTHVTKQLFE